MNALVDYVLGKVLQEMQDMLHFCLVRKSSQSDAVFRCATGYDMLECWLERIINGL